MYHDVTTRESNDFRSTKRDTRVASLMDADGEGVVAFCGGEQHVRAQVRWNGMDLLVLDRSIAGATPGWIDRYKLFDEDPTLEGGTRLQGTASISLIGGFPGGGHNDGDRGRGRGRDGDDDGRSRGGPW